MILYSSVEIQQYASLAQLDRAFVYGTKGQGFESLATHQIIFVCMLYPAELLLDITCGDATSSNLCSQTDK